MHGCFCVVRSGGVKRSVDRLPVGGMTFFKLPSIDADSRFGGSTVMQYERSVGVKKINKQFCFSCEAVGVRLSCSRFLPTAAATRRYGTGRYQQQPLPELDSIH